MSYKNLLLTYSVLFVVFLTTIITGCGKVESVPDQSVAISKCDASIIGVQQDDGTFVVESGLDSPLLTKVCSPDLIHGTIFPWTGLYANLALPNLKAGYSYPADSVCAFWVRGNVLYNTDNLDLSASTSVWTTACP